jgi:hypothetical protein
MAQARITEKIIFEDSPAQCLARVVGNDGAAIQQSDYGAITYAVFEEDTTTAIATGTLTVANVVFDAYQTDARWTVDATGYNFRTTIPASDLTAGDGVYRIEFLFSPTGQEQFFVIFQVTTIEVRTS